MEYQTDKIRHISHEIKNQLSICDLYTEVLKKYFNKNGIEDETITRAINSIQRAVQLAGNSLLELKSCDTTDIKPYKVSDLLNEALDLAKIYGVSKCIKFNLNIDNDVEIMADKNKFESVVINVIKNACEAFDESAEDKKISVTAKTEKGKVYVTISNNAKPIENSDKIFEEGYTTKSNGNGFGLAICKKMIEDMSGEFELVKSDNASTDFRITLNIA